MQGLPVAAWGFLGALTLWVFACRPSAEFSAQQARIHARGLAGTVEQDLEQLRQGLPLGAARIAETWPEPGSTLPDVTQARQLLQRSRASIRQLRVAKSTFFVLADLQGKVLRSDHTPDPLAGSLLFERFPVLRSVLGEARIVEARGHWAAAATVRGIPDGQWIAAHRVDVDSRARGIYATGWSWAAYAHRLEFSLRSDLKSLARQERRKLPLVYVYLSVAGNIFGAAQAPRVTAEAIAKLDIGKALALDPDWQTELSITGRTFGVGASVALGLGRDVFICVVRSET